MKNNFVLYVVAILFVILLSNNVYAIGISPGRTTIDFSPEFEKSVDVKIINSENKDMDLTVYVSGDLSDYVTLSGNSFRMSSSESERIINYKIKLPGQLKPGTYKTDIVVLQLPEESSDDGAVIGVSLAVMTQLVVNVPYPGKYIVSQLNINGASVGDEVSFIIPVKSMGQADIVSIKANIDIYNKLNEKIYTFNTNSISLESKGEAELIGKWKADVAVGTYFAKATVIYDGEVIPLEKLFNVGDAELELEEINVREFSLGEIAKLEMLVENKWGEEIKEVYTQTKIYDSEGKTLSEFKSPTYDIPALQKSVMVSYWDSAGYKEGTYDASVYLNYGQKSTQKDLQMKVSENNLEIVGLGYVISEKGKKSEGSSVNTLLIVAVIVLVLINFVWFMILRKKLSDKTKK